MESLIDFLLEYNNFHQLHDITVYSVWHPEVDIHPALRSNVNHYEYVHSDSFVAKVMKRIYKWMYRDGYYFYTIEYFIDQVLRRLRKRQFDIILIENRPAYALKLIGKTSARLVYHLHNGKLDTSVRDYQRIYDAADLIISVSDFVTQRVKTINPDDTKSVTVYNGIDLHAFRPDAPSRQMRSNWNLTDDDFVILYNGKINPQKGIMELIKAMKLLTECPHIKLLAMGSTFYGGNSYDDHPYAYKVLKEADAIKANITFTGYVPNNQMPDFLKLVDLAIIPSVWDEPFGLTAAEAQAVGLPIITTRRGGIPEVVSEQNAILLETDEHFVENLAAAILDLYQHPEKRKKMAAASIKRSRLFDKETYARHFFEALSTLNQL